MKTKFVHLLLIIPIIFVPSTYAAEECATNDNIIGRVLNTAGTREVIYYKNLIGKIRNLETGEDLFEGKNIEVMYVNGTRTNVLFCYADTTEMRCLKTGKAFCKDMEVSSVGVSEKVAYFLYKNSTVAIKDLENGKTLSEDKNVDNIIFKTENGVVLFFYKNGEMAVKNLESGKTIT